MAEPSAQDIQLVRDLEKAHKTLFYSLVAATQFWLGLSQKYSVLPVTDPRKKSLIAYGNKLIPIIGYWTAQQKNIEEAGIEKIPVTIADFFDRSKRAYLNNLVLKMNAEAPTTKGIGFIPLLIWAVVAIVAFFSTEKIVEQVDSTTVQQKDLVDSTNNFCKENNLSQQDCKDIFAQQQASIQTTDSSQGGGFFGEVKNILLLGILGFVGYKIYESSQHKKAA